MTHTETPPVERLFRAIHHLRIGDAKELFEATPRERQIELAGSAQGGQLLIQKMLEVRSLVPSHDRDDWGALAKMVNAVSPVKALIPASTGATERVTGSRALTHLPVTVRPSGPPL